MWHITTGIIWDESTKKIVGGCQGGKNSEDNQELHDS